MERYNVVDFYVASFMSPGLCRRPIYVAKFYVANFYIAMIYVAALFTSPPYLRRQYLRRQYRIFNPPAGRRPGGVGAEPLI